MSRSTSLAVLLGAAAVLSALALLLFVRPSDPPESLAGVEPAAPAEQDAPSEVQGSSDLAPGDAEADAELVARRTVGAAEPAELPADGPTLEGRLLLPAGTPADERVTVLALASAHDLRALYRERGPAAAQRAGETHDELLAAVAPDADGRYRLELPPGTGEVHLALSGRYVFSRATTPSGRSVRGAFDAPPVLTGELGAWVTGTLRVSQAPRARAGEEPPLRATRVELGADTSAGFVTTALDELSLTLVTEADEDGAFEFCGVPCGVDRGVVVKHGRLAALRRLGLSNEPGTRLELDLTLQRGATVAGRVVDELGEPLEGAAIEVRYRGPTGDGIKALREGTSRPDGTFRLEHVATGEVKLVAGYGDYRGQTLALELQDGDVVDDALLTLEAGLSIAGQVRFPDGAPAVAAFVRVGPDIARAGGVDGMQMRSAGGGSAQADEQGRFRVRGLIDVPYRVRASWPWSSEGDDPLATLAALSPLLAEGEIGVQEAQAEAASETAASLHPDQDHEGRWSAQLDDVRPGPGEVSLVLDPLAMLAGRVTDLAGEPLTRFRVAATLKDSGGMFGIGAERQAQSFGDDADEAGDGASDASDSGEAGEAGEAGAEGTFEMFVAPGTWQVVVTAEGYSTSELVELTLPAAPGSDPHTFALAPAARASGVVLDAAGRPISGARVTVQLDLASRLAALQEGGAPTTFSGAEGRFTFDDLDPGPLQLVASYEGFASSAPVAFEALAGETADELELRLRTGGTLTGEVLGDDGEPRGGRMVIVQRVPEYEPQHMLTADAEGTFRVEHLEPGQWQVVATVNFLSEDQESSSSMLEDMKFTLVEIVDGEETHVVLGAAASDPVRVQGRVVHGGEGVGGAFVSFLPEDPEGMNDMRFRTVDGDGRFEIDLDRPGAYLVTVQFQSSMGHQNSVEFQERIPDVEEHRLELELPLGRISGTVLGPDGDPLVGCRVTLHVEGGVAYGSFLGGHYTETATDEDGAYDIPYLDQGTYSVAAGGASMGGAFGKDARAGREARGGLRVDEGQHLTGVDFRLREPGELHGVVRDPSGAPIAGAAIFVRDGDGRVLERFSLVTTDSGGRFVYAGVAEGTYTVESRRKGLASPERARVHVPEGGRGEAELRLEPGTILRVAVDDRKGDEVRAKIQVLDEDGRDVGGMRSMEEIMAGLAEGLGKEQRFGPLPAGSYRVTATTADGRSARKTVSLRGQAERKLNIRMK